MLMAMHFSNIPFLANLIVPTMPSLHANSWREFGILENLQHIYLLIMLAICIHASRIKEHRLEKYGALLLALFTTFIFLEEIDYGLHYYEWIFGIDPNEPVTQRNLHNSSAATLKNIRRTVDVVMAILFLIIPLISKNIRNPIFNYLAPNRWLLGTALCIIGLSELAHSWDDHYLRTNTEPHRLMKNVSEFREITMYYIFLLYYWELAYKRAWPSQKNDHSTA